MSLTITTSTNSGTILATFLVDAHRNVEDLLDVVPITGPRKTCPSTCTCSATRCFWSKTLNMFVDALGYGCSWSGCTCSCYTDCPRLTRFSGIMRCSKLKARTATTSASACWGSPCCSRRGRRSPSRSWSRSSRLEDLLELLVPESWWQEIIRTLSKMWRGIFISNLSLWLTLLKVMGCR